MVTVSWNVPAGQMFEAALRVKARNRDRLLSDMLQAIGGEGLIINEASARALAGGLAEGYFVVQIKNAEQLRKTLTLLLQVPDVIDAQRTEPK
jgi:(p)ppGpp synthase/HD superfamily hydrolase